MTAMLERIDHGKGLVTWQSPRLQAVGVRHGFTTRRGGCSEAPYDSLNLGWLQKDPATDANMHVAENFRRVRAALALERVPRYELRQVHGADVWHAPERPVRWQEAPCADVIVTDRPGRLLVVRTADCVPILLASQDGRQVAAIHAGWRGIVAGVIEAAVAQLRQLGGEASIAAIGPCISIDHFEVGPEVARRFPANCVRQQPGQSAFVDLRQAAVGRLAAVGVKQVDVTEACTYRDEADFFSHRRDVTHRGLEATGRMAALVAAREKSE